MTGVGEYFRNGLKVGPDYKKPAAAVSSEWIDSRDPRVSTAPPLEPAWWKAFNDPVLDHLTSGAYQQNLTLKAAGFRVLEARYRRAIAVGELFPQTQQAFGSYTRNQISLETQQFPGIERNYAVWAFGGRLAWELDFWGRFRRSIEAADAELDASIEDYDNVLVVLLAETAGAYVEARTLEQRIRYAKSNVKFQRGSLEIAKLKQAGGAASQLDVAQAVTNVAQTEAIIPPLERQLRQTHNALCVLLGIPPQTLTQLLGGDGHIPHVDPQVALGVPADLLRRRPDVRRAERLVAAQSARIGVVEADLYPAFSINGTISIQANQFKDLWRSSAQAGQFAPQFNWNVLNYGRIRNAVNLEESRFMQFVMEYQNTVLDANREAENAVVAFLRAQEQAKVLREGVAAAVESRDLVNALYRGGRADFGRVFFAEYFLVQQQDMLAQAEGDIALGLVAIYRSLGGGWQIRLNNPPQMMVGGQAPIPVNPVPVNPAPVNPIPPEPVPSPPPAGLEKPSLKRLPAAP